MIQRISKGHSKTSSKKKSGFVYKPRSERQVKDRAEQQGGRFDSPFNQGVDIWRPKAGDNLIRILPPTWDEADHYGMDIWIHGFVGADNGSYLCPQKMQNKSCPICKAAKECRDAGENDEAKQLEPKKQVLTYIIDRDSDSQLPQIYAMSWTMDRDIAALCYNKRTGKILSIDHPDEGYDVTIKRSGQGLNTRYFGIAIDRDPSPISDDAKDQDKIMEFLQENPLPGVLKFYPIEHLQKVMDGVAEQPDEDADEDEDEEQDEQKERRTKKPGKKKPARDEDDDEEVDDDEQEEESEDEDETDESEESDDEDEEQDEDSDDEEEEKPRRPLKSRRRGNDDEDDESEDEEADSDEDESEDEESDDEEEEERPARRGKPTHRRKK